MNRLLITTAIVILIVSFFIYKKYSLSPTSCTIKKWSEWSDCNVSCGEGIRYRTRTSKGNCPSIERIQYESCFNMTCPIDCVGDWIDITGSVCNPTTSSTYKYQTYVVETPSQYGGNCPYENTTQSVNCPINCIGHWEDAAGSVCNPTTSSTYRYQTYVIDSPSQHGGICLHENERKSIQCPIDCSGRWEKVIGSVCNPTTSSSIRYEKYVVDSPSRYGGNCQYENMTKSIQCPIDCIGHWIDVTGSVCNPTTSSTYRYQMYIVDSPSQYGGKCQYENTTKSIQCPIDCLGRWEDITGSVCNPTTSSTYKYQTYVIDRSSQYGGKCQYENMTKSVQCPINCVGRWEDITGSVCNPTTSSTYRYQTYVVDRASQYGGTCLYENTTKSIQCPIDCIGRWEDITGSVCNPTTSSTRRYQTYIVSSPSQFNGTCRYQNMTQSIQCPIDCVGRWEDATGSECKLIAAPSSFKQQFYRVDTPSQFNGTCRYENMTQNINCTNITPTPLQLDLNITGTKNQYDINTEKAEYKNGYYLFTNNIDHPQGNQRLISNSNKFSLNNGGTITFLLWFNSGFPYGYGQTLFSKMDTGKSGYRAILYRSNGAAAVQFYFNTSSGGYSIAESTVYDFQVSTNWAMVYYSITQENGSRTVRYSATPIANTSINDIQTVTNTYSSSYDDTYTPFSMGYASGGYQSFSGKMGELIFYNQTLTTDQVNQIFKQTRTYFLNK